jgi:hypothetical protein
MRINDCDHLKARINLDSLIDYLALTLFLTPTIARLLRSHPMDVGSYAMQHYSGPSLETSLQMVDSANHSISPWHRKVLEGEVGCHGFTTFIALSDLVLIQQKSIQLM